MTTSGAVPRSTSRRNIFDRLLAAAGIDRASHAAPARVRAAIARHEARSEILVGWFQLAGVLVFAALYAASYAAFDVHAAVEPAPVALALYAGATALRLRAAHTGALTRPWQYASIVADIALFVALMASFPLQYGLPPALYLKAPTLSYVFVLVALRALRFDPAQVLVAGALAAAGWAALAVHAAAAGAEITGSYPRYMTSLSLLPGAELEKIAAISAFALVLALGVARARSLLVRTIVEETATADLSKFVGGAAAAKIRASRDGVQSGDGELVDAAIMVIDLRGFSAAASALGPRGALMLLQDYQRRFVPLIEAGGGAIDKFLGDGILVSFGAARASATACADALRAAMALFAEARRASAVPLAGAPELEVCIALAAGEVVYGAVGFDTRLEYTVIGDAVNVAAKLEKHAKSQRALVIATADFAAAAARQGFAPAIARKIDGAVVDGLSRPVDLAIFA